MESQASARVERLYNVPDVVATTVMLTLLANAKRHVVALQERRTTWSDAFFTEVEDEVKKALKDHLGLTPEAARMAATATVVTNFTTMRTDARKLMVDIPTLEGMTADRKTELLTVLGFEEHYTEVAAKKAEALTELLFKIQKNLTAAVRKELTDLGINDKLLGRLLGYADQFTVVRVQQTALKQSEKELTDNAIREFNRLYERVIAIAKVAQDEFKADKSVKQQFVFKRLAASLGQARKAKPEAPAA